MKKTLFVCAITVIFHSAIASTQDVAIRKNGILLIGDSISEGYTPYVQEKLPCVFRTGGPRANDRDTWFILNHMEEWLEGSSYKIIYFNTGLWDISRRIDEKNNQWALDPTWKAQPFTSINDYKNNLDKITTRLRKTGAIVIFATTTDVPNKSIGRKNSDVITYNNAAKAVMSEHKIPVDDLYDLAIKHSELHKISGTNKVHYTHEGSRLLAERVVATLESYGGCELKK